MVKFQAELDNERDFFNASNDLVIAQANTAWRQSVATVNTAQLNEANMEEVLAANNLTMAALNELYQEERDLISYAFDAAKLSADSETRIAVATLNKEGAIADSDSSSGGNILSTILGAVGTKVLSNVFNVDVDAITKT